jgi:hypothetical protein
MANPPTMACPVSGARVNFRLGHEQISILVTKNPQKRKTGRLKIFLFRPLLEITFAQRSGEPCGEPATMRARIKSQALSRPSAAVEPPDAAICPRYGPPRCLN